MINRRLFKLIKCLTALMSCGFLIFGSITSSAENIKLSSRQYRIAFDEQSTFYISNAKAVSGNVGDKVFFTYTVEEVSKKDNTQFGIIATKDNKATFPYVDDGCLYLGDQSLLEVGYTYVFRMERTEMGFEYQCGMLKGDEAIDVMFERSVGTVDCDFNYYGIWIGGYGSSSAVLSHVRCYDADGNNLGIDTNYNSSDWWKGPVRITYVGEIDDYSKAEAVYYCAENNRFIILKDSKKAVTQINGAEKNYNYVIRNEADDEKALYLKSDEGKEIFNFLFQNLKDADNNEYVRMKESTVTFITGKEKFTESASASNGFKVEKPKTPEKKGNTFKEWCLKDGTPFDFDKVVTNSVTLYAKWIDGDNNEYIAVASDNVSGNSMTVAIIISAIVAVGCGVWCVCIAWRKKKG